MTINAWLAAAQKKLEKTDISTARLDALVLLEDCLHTDRAQLLAHPELELSAEQLKVLNSQIARRAKHEPLAYIRGKSEFYGRDFYVDHRVLEPRPESETIIDLLKEIATQNDTIVDVGTGSGALAITAKLEIPEAKVVAIDVDHNCLDVAQKNAETYKTDIEFLHGNLLEPLTTEPTILICNLPYVPDDFQINTAAGHEPKLAIFGGPDGLDLYRVLFKQLKGQKLLRPSRIICESLPPQHKRLAEIAKANGYKQSKEDDFIQLFELV